MMSHGKNSKLFRSDLIDDAVWEPTENVLPPSAAKLCAEQRIGQNEIGCSFKLGYKRETKLGVCLQRIERGRIV